MRKSFFITTFLIFLVFALQILSAEPQNLDETIVRVLLAESLNNCEIASSAGFVLNYENKEIKIDSSRLEFQIKNNRLFIFNEKKSEILSSNDKIKIFPQSKDDKLKLNNIRYRGYFVINIKGNSFNIINYVKLNEYLYGVLPKELNTDVAEAEKFQAVIAKNFVLYKCKKNKDSQFDVYSDFRDQAYGGYEAEDPKINQYVDIVKDVVLTYNGALAGDVCYFSSCGGATASNQDVFLNDPVPYSQAVECTLDSFLNFLKTKDSDKYNKFKNNIKDIDEEKLKEPLCADSKFNKWNVSISKDEILENLPQYSAERMSEIENIKILSRDNYGRALEVKITGKNKNILVRGNRIRWVLSFKNDKGLKQILYSTNFDIKSKENNLYELEGRGWGHGVGLCQMGALKLATLGASFEDILEFYYRGAMVGSRQYKLKPQLKSDTKVSS